VPDAWQYKVSETTKKQFTVLKKLMERSDVESIIEATDAGREGELIFRLVYHKAGCKKPFERLWISSMEDAAIRDGFANLKEGSRYDSLYEAALCRERADWLVGINATRLFSTLYGATLNVGRVMTPTLSMMVQREAEIRDFEAEAFYTVQISVGGVTVVSDKFQKKQEAEKVLQAVEKENAALVTKKETAEKKEKAPPLYDLTSLQREANRIMGFSAQQTLDYAQSLYEKKLITYPRTDSRYLTEDMEEHVKGLIPLMTEKFGFAEGLNVHTRQVINNKKVSDHHALLPTKNVSTTDLGELPSGEAKILSLITARLLASVGDPYVYEETALEVSSGGTIFKARGKQEKSKGFKEVQEWILGKAVEEKEADPATVYLNNLQEGKNYPLREPIIKEGKTTPKKHFTEDSLLAAMERAGVEEMPENAEHKGIGTPATRAGIIEKLVRIGFVERLGDKKTKYLIPTSKGVSLIKVTPEEIRSPVMTAEWEEKLTAIEAGEYEPEKFMNGILEMLFILKRDYKVIEGAKVQKRPATKVVGKCPCCGSEVAEKMKGYFCSDKDCHFVLWKDQAFFASLGKKITPSAAGKLLKEGKVFLTGCRSAKTGNSYDATVLMRVDERKRPQFSLSFEKGEK
jgi:DNA topoisomerase-3